MKLQSIFQVSKNLSYSDAISYMKLLILWSLINDWRFLSLHFYSNRFILSKITIFGPNKSFLSIIFNVFGIPTRVSAYQPSLKTNFAPSKTKIIHNISVITWCQSGNPSCGYACGWNIRRDIYTVFSVGPHIMLAVFRDFKKWHFEKS